MGIVSQPRGGGKRLLAPGGGGDRGGGGAGGGGAGGTRPRATRGRPRRGRTTPALRHGRGVPPEGVRGPRWRLMRCPTPGQGAPPAGRRRRDAGGPAGTRDTAWGPRRSAAAGGRPRTRASRDPPGAVGGDRDAVRVPPQILQDLVGAAEGRLGVDDPVRRPEGGEERGKGHG